MAYKRSRILLDDDLGIEANKIATNDSELSSGKLVKSTPTGISSADLSDHLEGTPGQITVSPHGTGGAKVGLPTTGTFNIPINTAIGSSSAPATLNVYGQSTLRDRLTVPKDGSNSTSGIIDVGDSYYLGGSRWIHNQGGNTCTAVGYLALRDNTTGISNSAMGFYALRFNTEGSYNSAMGSIALYSNETGSNNSAMGYSALCSNETGSNNSAMGYAALCNNETGSSNSAMGYNALRDNETGSNNSAMGYAALCNNETGSRNSAMGYSALRDNETGSNNSAMGYAAGRYIANGSTSKTTGDNNLYLGSETKAKEDGTNNEIVIGANAIGLGSNSMVLGHTTNLLTALRGKVGIGTNAPEHGLHVGTNYNSNGNIKANNKLIAGTDVEAGNNVTAVETVQGKNIAADNNIDAGNDITAQNNVTGFIVNAIKDINAGNNVIAGYNITAQNNVNAGRDVTANRDVNAGETITGKKLVATQSITAGTTIDADGDITSGGNVTADEINVRATTASTSTTTGALKVTGGVGIGGAINVGGKAKITDATQATATGAALEVTGGIKAGNNLRVNGSAQVGSLQAGGDISAGGSVSASGDGSFQGDISSGKGGVKGNIIANNSVQIGETLEAYNGGELIITDNKYDGNNEIIRKGYVNAGHTIVLSGKTNVFNASTPLDNTKTVANFTNAPNETIQAQIQLNIKLIGGNYDSGKIVFEEILFGDIVFRFTNVIQSFFQERMRICFNGDGAPAQSSGWLLGSPSIIMDYSDNEFVFGIMFNTGKITALLSDYDTAYFVYSLRIDSNSLGMESNLLYNNEQQINN